MSQETTGTDHNELLPSAAAKVTGANKDAGPSDHRSFDTDGDTYAPTRREMEFTAAELPGVLSKELFMELANHKSVHCISIYLGTHAAGEEINEHIDQIRLKGYLHEAELRLQESGFHNGREIEQLLAPGYSLVGYDHFWKAQGQGLAVFMAENYFRFIRMPIAPLEELLMIESSFYVTPLVPVLTSSEYFYVLVISKQCAKLFKGDAWGMHYIPLTLPQSIQEVKRLSDLDATTFRSGSNGSRGPRYSQEGVYHGVSGGNPDDKDNMQVYFQAVDDIIWKEVLHNQHVPLVIAAVEYEVPIYKSICNYNHVWPEALTGNRDTQDTATLYQEAKTLLKPFFEERTVKALAQYMNNSATGSTSSIVADVIPAAYYAQVSTLFVAKGVHLWGSFDEKNNELQLHDTQTEDSEDLIDNAVEKTLANGGEVFILDQEQMPAPSPIAALMRF